MNLAADLGGIFIVPDVTAHAFAPVIIMRQADPGDKLDSDQFIGGNGPSQVILTFGYALKTFARVRKEE